MRSASRRRAGRLAPLAVAAIVLLAASGAPAAATEGRAAAPAGVTLDEAIRLALANNPALNAAREQTAQSRAQELTAGLRPNPVFSTDAQFIPLFHPDLFSGDYVRNQMQFDAGVSYLFERAGKRGRRVDAARGQTDVVGAQVQDAERLLAFNVATQWIGALLARSNLTFAEEALGDFQEAVKLNEERRRAGDISEGDLLKIRIQMLQFQSDVNAARLARILALASLRQSMGYQSVPAAFDVGGDLAAGPFIGRLADLETMALERRPDLRASALGVEAARRQLALAEANAAQDPTVTLAYTHAAGTSAVSAFASIPLPVFNRNQGEVARTRAALAQSELARKASEDAVRTDVRNAFEASASAAEVVALYQSGYLKTAQDSREIAAFAYRRGAASLIDYLDAERSYRSVQLAYRQALAASMLAAEQVRQAVGSR